MDTREAIGPLRESVACKLAVHELFLVVGDVCVAEVVDGFDLRDPSREVIIHRRN